MSSSTSPWPLGPEAEADLGWTGPLLQAMVHRLPLRLLTWDVKDTLLRLRHPVGVEYASKALAHGLQVEAAALGQAFPQVYKAQSHSFPNYGLSQGLTSRQWWLDVILQTFHQAGVGDAQVVIPIADQLYEDFSHPHTWQVLEGAKATLKGCQKRGLRLAVVSNFDRRLENILVGLGLRVFLGGEERVGLESHLEDSREEDPLWSESSPSEHTKSELTWQGGGEMELEETVKDPHSQPPAFCVHACVCVALFHSVW